MRILEKIGLLTLLALLTWAPIAAASYWLAPKGLAPKNVETAEHPSDRYLRSIRIAKAAPATEVASTLPERAHPDHTPPSVPPPEAKPAQSTPSESIAPPAALGAPVLRPPVQASALPAEPVSVAPKKSAKPRAARKDRRYVKRNRPKTYATRSAPQGNPFLFGFFN